MIRRDLPVTMFIDGIVHGLLSNDLFDCKRTEQIYRDAFELGLSKKGDDAFLKCLLNFWTHYVYFMEGTDVVVACCLEQCCDSGDECACHCEPDETQDAEPDEDDEVD